MRHDATNSLAAQNTMERVHHLVLYDGVCALCNRSIKFILKRDRVGTFRFAPLESPLGQALRQKYHLTTQETVCVVENHDQANERFWMKGDAVVFVLNLIPGYRIVGFLFRLLPRTLRDHLYDLIAARRYRWFGKYDVCPLPDAKQRSRFLS